MNPNANQSVAVDLSGDAPMVVSAVTAAEMFVAAREALEASGFSTEGLTRSRVKQMRREQMATPVAQESPLANVSDQEAQRARSIGVEYV
ncbi:hypothetical protein [Halomonas citrativorans]|uniref:hypothetical protein n=1 Tax=Halomonas TaxID=2745 RepID=UPI0018669597|nr:hypothetical protein [Halomonas citrativorans]